MSLTPLELNRVMTLPFVTTDFVSPQEPLQHKDDPGDNTGLAAGAGIGGAVVVILVIIGVVVFIRYCMHIRQSLNLCDIIIIVVHSLCLFKNIGKNTILFSCSHDLLNFVYF